MRWFILFFAPCTIISQSQQIADSLREEGNLEAAIQVYRQVAQSNPTLQSNLYNLACAYGIQGPEDSCYHYLYRAVHLDTSASALIDPDFLQLRSGDRWMQFEDSLVAMLNMKFHHPYQNEKLARSLWKMYAKDQACYSDLDIVEKKLGRNSSVERQLWTLKHIYNEENVAALEAIVQSSGWPTISAVGGSGAAAAFLIIQHSNLEKQMQYLPMIEELCKKKEARWANYALMYDRVQTGQGKLQKYGSQLRYNETTQSYELFPLQDPGKVDQWRAEAGLEPLSEYVKHWNLVWPPK